MAKLKNKVSKNKQKKVNGAVNQQVSELKKRMEQQVAEQEYVDAMDTMAEIAKMKQMDADIMYMGAYCYVMTDDNQRAITWINHCLSYAPDHIPARILLGRICMVEDRNEDGLKVFNFLLEKLENRLSEENKAELEELLDYYRYSESEMVVEKYPSVANFLGLEDEEEVSVPVAVEEKVVETKPVPAVQEENQEEHVEEDAASRAKAAVARLRALLNKNKQEQETEPEEKDEIEEVEEQDSTSDEYFEEDDEEPAEVQNEFDVEGTTNQIMAKEISLREKIKLFNTFAASCYIKGDYQSAFDLLNGALLLDSGDDVIIKNLAYVCAAAGEKEQAMEFAAKLPMIDFGLLCKINE